MKKVSLLFTAGVISILFLSLNSCKKKKITTANCEEYVNAYYAATTAYVTNPNEDNCIALATSLKNYIDNCAILTSTQKQQFEQEYNNLNCQE
jgi:hypothetical protein